MIYEFRVYETLPGRAPDLAARFKNFNRRIFDRHGIKLVGTWLPEDNPNDHFAYMVAFDDDAQRQRAWKGFREDEEWRKMFEEENRTNKIFKASLFGVILRPTDSSPMA